MLLTASSHLRAVIGAGIVLVVVGSDGVLGLGIALILLASVPLAAGFALLFSGSVARWAARHRLFA